MLSLVAVPLWIYESECGSGRCLTKIGFLQAVLELSKSMVPTVNQLLQCKKGDQN